jgi:hypothetical protein
MKTSGVKSKNGDKPSALANRCTQAKVTKHSILNLDADKPAKTSLTHDFFAQITARMGLMELAAYCGLIQA